MNTVGTLTLSIILIASIIAGLFIVTAIALLLFAYRQKSRTIRECQQLLHLVRQLDQDKLQPLLEHEDLTTEQGTDITTEQGTEECRTQQKDASELNYAEQKFVTKLTDVVHKLMAEQRVDVNTVASQLNMSPSQLRRKLTTITGLTPIAYIMQIRLTYAQRLIDAHPEMSVTDVAWRCGFADQSHLSHAFQKAYGVSPTQWARRVKKSPNSYSPKATPLNS